MRKIRIGGLVFRFVDARTRLPRTRRGSEKHEEAKAAARALAHARLAHFNQYYGFAYAKVFIRSQKTRWGACSAKGNLGFNYRIAFLPPHLADYVIVHELCHLGAFNHSPAFWNLVAETTPNHKELRRELRTSYRF
ncbi:MAG: M48 family metallopeptidase [Patescibacteria group bacterium]|nr:M48 family metallopeptidase [Patescibacteria group bacterium]MDE1965730.1 M48 family metallopeptidase [Patescibacteria group bacterium]